jgi:hypothetical protein
MVVGAVKSLGDGEEEMEEVITKNIGNLGMTQIEIGGYQGMCLHLWR